MPDPQPVLGKSCLYQCVGEQWTLIGGSAPPGYSCPLILGGCVGEGSTAEAYPVPISQPPDVASRAPLATYNYDLATNQLYFSNGTPAEGFGFANQLSLEECVKLYPELAAKFQEIQASLDLSGLKLELPGLPIQMIAAWYKSKSAKGLA